ncbi:hypothetical protein B0H14DRAFT_2640263 [Mycena olivaceomarginata]|nr:hypothetical protein B0H14DRAFT_2640263 [Mycena olivaceomarginata]
MASLSTFGSGPSSIGSFNDIGNLADRPRPYPTATRIGEPEKCCAAKKKCCAHRKGSLPVTDAPESQLMCMASKWQISYILPVQQKRCQGYISNVFQMQALLLLPPKSAKTPTGMRGATKPHVGVSPRRAYSQVTVCPAERRHLTKRDRNFMRAALDHDFSKYKHQIYDLIVKCIIANSDAGWFVVFDYVSAPFAIKFQSLAVKSSVWKSCASPDPGPKPGHRRTGSAGPWANDDPCNARIRAEGGEILGPPVAFHDWRSSRTAETLCSVRGRERCF